MTVRPATPDDAPAITAVHAHHVLHTVATFDLVPPTVEQRVARLAEHPGGRGQGRALYAELFAELAGEGVHRAFGFTRVGTFGEVGHTFGRWVDVAWFQKEM